MKKIYLATGISFVLLLLNPLFGQQNQPTELTSDEINAYKEKVKGLVNYVESTLNFIGDPETAPREKEIAISESYLKVFKDDKVQIEDDLDDNRDVPLHKDVQAYLKDIRFFFRQAEFTFNIEKVDHFVNNQNNHFFKVTYNRQLKAITVSGDTIDSRKTRYMEVNLDPIKNDLKIASIYTTKLNEKEEIITWWNGLNSTWRNIFGKGRMVWDTLELSRIESLKDSLVYLTPNAPAKPDSSGYEVSFPIERIQLSALGPDSVIADIREIINRIRSVMKQKTLDISENEVVQSLEPLSELTELREIDCQGTTITDLLPLRNLNNLEVLDVSNTPVEDLSPLKYSISLRELRCSFTLIRSMEPVTGLTNLELLECSGLRLNDLDFVAALKNLTSFECSETLVHDGEPLKQTVQLRELDISGTLIGSLAFADNLLYLKYLNCQGTPVKNVEPLKNLEQLEILKISNTQVESLQPLESLENLKRIYWDSDDPYLINTKQRRERAIAFMDRHPGTLVIFETDALEREWKSMEARWKDAISEAAGLPENPSQEELHKVIRIETLSLTSGAVESLEPLTKLYNLKQLDISGLKTKDYSHIGELIELQELNISNTAVTNLDFLTNLYNLKIVRAEHTQVSSLQPLESLVNLEFVYVDHTLVDDEDASRLKEISPECLIIYKSNVLMEWWQALSHNWQDFLTAKFQLHTPPTKEQLHRLLFLQSLEITGSSNISDLIPLAMLSHLQSLKLNSLPIGNMEPLIQLRDIRELSITQMPVIELSFLASFSQIEILILENTSVRDIDPVKQLQQLKTLNISGTQVKNLRPLSSLNNLKTLQVNNSRVRSLKPVEDISLKLLECYNTRVTSNNLERFKEANPDCKVVYY